MLLERLLDNLAVRAEPFARCEVSSGCCLDLHDLGWVTLHDLLQGEGKSQQAPLGNGLIVACGELPATYADGLDPFDLLTDPVAVDLSDHETMLTTFERMLDESSHPSPGSRVMLTSWMDPTLVLLFRRRCGGEQCDPAWLDAVAHPRMAAVLEVLLERPGDDHPLEPLAELPRRTDLTVDRVSRRVGFASRSHFSHAFTPHVDRSPMTFRSAALSAAPSTAPRPHPWSRTVRRTGRNIPAPSGFPRSPPTRCHDPLDHLHLPQRARPAAVRPHRAPRRPRARHRGVRPLLHLLQGPAGGPSAGPGTR